MLGADTAQFSAEIDFDGAMVAKEFLKRHNLKQLHGGIKDERDLEKLLIEYTEESVRFIGKSQHFLLLLLLLFFFSVLVK